MERGNSVRPSITIMAHQDAKHAHEAVGYLLPKLPAELQKPAIGIVCGSGLGGLADALLDQPRVAVPYSNVPHFAQSTGSHIHIRLALFTLEC